MRINLPLFSQRDDLWKNKKLGASTVTIGGYGCLVTCLAMVAKYYGKQTTPDQMNQDLVRVQGFANDRGTVMGTGANRYIWTSLTKIYSDITETKRVETPSPISSQQFADWEAELNAGRPVILKVDFIPATTAVDEHYVVLVGKEGDQWIVADPWYGDTASLTRYGKPEITTQRFVFTAGPIQSTPVDQPDDSQKIILGLIQKGWNELPGSDPNKGNQESYVRSMIDDYKVAEVNAEKAKQLDGLISKWTQEWQLPADGGLVAVEGEMAKLLDTEDLKNRYRDEIEKVVGSFEDDDALLKALSAVKDDMQGIQGKLEKCELKLKGTNVVRTFKIGPYIVKVFTS